MNWRRGLLRTWVVVSICWVGVVGGYGVYNWYNDPWRVVSQKPADCGETKPWTKYHKECLELAPWLKSPPLWDVLLHSIGPPSALLLFGVVLWWIGQGFRERT